PHSCSTERTCSRMNYGGTGCTPVTAFVFWAVNAVSAVAPCTPAWANALRSAWIPAPPPESDPAIDRHTGTRSGMGPMIGGTTIGSFDQRRRHEHRVVARWRERKGVPGEWRLFAVA